jgi:Heterokaryon incompatibility protein (HET)
LSHCWGQSPSLLLKKDSLGSFMNEICISKLPKTYTDAIRITRELEVQYLWIDSLCIIQDSDEDWRQESAMMDKVYSNTYCTIAAAASRDGDGGLFFRPDTPAATPCKIRCTWNPAQPTTFLCHDDTPWIDVEFGPLYSRAWVLQERLLSPCMLLFAGDQVYWECSELIASDSCPSGLPSLIHLLKTTWSSIIQSRPPPVGQLLFVSEAKASLSRSSTANDANGRVKIGLRQAWAYIVSAYTYGELTFASDKLIAFSGLARQSAKVLNFPAVDYLAGIWRSELESQLLWSTSTQAETKQLRGPSWSWSSVDGWITPIFLEIMESATIWIDSWSSSIKVVEASTTPVADPYGPVKGGHLIIQGPVCRIKCPEEEIEPRWWHHPNALFNQKDGTFEWEDVQLSWSVDILSPDEVEIGFVYLLPTAVVGFARRDLSDEASPEIDFSIASQVLNLPRKQDASLEKSTAGLLLAKTLAAKGQYQRIGTFKVRHEGIKATLRGAVNARTMPEGDYLDFDGCESYTIRIV